MKKLITLSICLLLIAAYAYSNGTEESEKKATLQVILNQTWNKPSFEPGLREYEEANPNITIDLQVIPDEQFSSLLKTRIATKQYPDVYLDNFGQISQLYKVPELLVDLGNESWVNRLLSTDGVKVDGKIYGLPMNGTPSVQGFVYNKDVFENVGVEVPTSYEEFVAVCEKIKAAGIAPIAVTAKDNWTIGMWIIEIMPQVVMEKANIWTDLNTGAVRYNEIPEFAMAISRMKELVLDKGFANKDFLSTTYDMGNTMVAKGEAAMVVQGDWACADIAKNFPDANVGMFPFPIVSNPRFTSGFTPAFTILKESKNVSEAKALLEFLASPEQMKNIANDWGYVPAVTDVQVVLNPWIQDVVDNYISKGQSPIPEMGVTSIISIGELAKNATNMLTGSMSSDEVMTEWQIYFEEQATIRKLPGWN
jgi:raffinose/stachyose/melibiose transport system substrate-binding protein